MSSTEKVLVFLLGSLGDSIVAIPALRMVRDNFPSAEIVVLHESGLELVEPPDVIPTTLVDRYLAYERGRRPSLSYLRLLPRLRSENFDAAVYLVFSERPAVAVRRDRRYFRAAGIKRLIGFEPVISSEIATGDELRRLRKVPQEAEQKVTRLEADGLHLNDQTMSLPWIEVSSEDKAMARDWLRKGVQGSTLLAVAPGCKMDANRWPPERFIDVIRSLREISDLGFVIVGGRAEAAIGDDISAKVSRCVNAAGKFSVRQTAALLHNCDAYVGLDTGTTHLAAALGLPVVAIYGQRNDPGQWFPIATQLEVVQRNVVCAGCKLQACNQDDHPCMTGIEVDQVAAAVTRMLGSVEALSRKASGEAA